MKYTGKYRSVYSHELGEGVDILEYTSKDKVPYCDCDKCGKPIVRKMFVVQSQETGVEMLYLGSECVKHLT